MHFIIGRNGGPTPRPRRDELEDAVAELTLHLRRPAARRGARPERRSRTSSTPSPPPTSRATPPSEALADIGVHRRRCRTSERIALRLGARDGGDGACGSRSITAARPIPLSDRVPMLENFGFRVIDERTYTVEPRGGGETLHPRHGARRRPGATLDDRGAAAPQIEDAHPRGLAERGRERRAQPADRCGPACAGTMSTILRALTRYLRRSASPIRAPTSRRCWTGIPTSRRRW